MVGDILAHEGVYNSGYFSDGTVLHSGPGEIRYIPKGAKYRMERVKPGGTWLLGFELKEPVHQPPFSKPLRDYGKMLEIFKEAAKAVEKSWVSETVFVECIVMKCIYAAIIQLRRECLYAYSPSREAQLIAPAIAQIHRHYMEPGGMEGVELAKLCNISENYFRKLFKKQFSIAPGEYVIRLRISLAKKLLSDRSCPISRIALECGYSEPCHFSREFSKHVGMSPREYRRSAKHD